MPSQDPARDPPSTPSVRVARRFASVVVRDPPSVFIEHSVNGIQRHASQHSSSTESSGKQQRSGSVAQQMSSGNSRMFTQYSSNTYTARGNYAARALHEFMAQCGSIGSSEQLSDLLNEAAQTAVIQGTDELPPERATVMAESITRLLDPKRRPAVPDTPVVPNFGHVPSQDGKTPGQYGLSTTRPPDTDQDDAYHAASHQLGASSALAGTAKPSGGGSSAAGSGGLPGFRAALASPDGGLRPAVVPAQDASDDEDELGWSTRDHGTYNALNPPPAAAPQARRATDALAPQTETETETESGAVRSTSGGFTTGTSGVGFTTATGTSVGQTQEKPASSVAATALEGESQQPEGAVADDDAPDKSPPALDLASAATSAAGFTTTEEATITTTTSGAVQTVDSKTSAVAGPAISATTPPIALQPATSSAPTAAEDSQGFFQRHGRQQTLAPEGSGAMMGHGGGATSGAGVGGGSRPLVDLTSNVTSPHYPSPSAPSSDPETAGPNFELAAARQRADAAEWALRSLLQSVLRAAAAAGASSSKGPAGNRSGPFRGRTGTVTTLSSQPSGQPSAAFSPGQQPSLAAAPSAAVTSASLIHATSFVHGHVHGRAPPMVFSAPTVVIPALEASPNKSPQKSANSTPNLSPGGLVPAPEHSGSSASAPSAGSPKSPKASGGPVSPRNGGRPPRRVSVSISAPGEDDIRSIMSLAAAPFRQTNEAKVTEEMPDGTMELNQYVVLSLLGAGAQGEVFLAFDNTSNQLRAVKAVRRPKRTHKSFRIASNRRGDTAVSPAAAQPAPRPGSAPLSSRDASRDASVAATTTVPVSASTHQAPPAAAAATEPVAPPPLAETKELSGGEYSVANLVSPEDVVRDMLEREISIMKKCRHRNVVTLYEVIDDPDQDCMYLVMQYVDQGPLVKLDTGGFTSKSFPPRRVANYGRQLCAGLQYLHGHGVIHRDIKPDNILLGSGDQVYLADFGVADLFEHLDEAAAESSGEGPLKTSPTEAFGKSIIKDTRGTLAFMAPEVLDPDARDCDGRSVDVWALGVTLYALVYGRLPFPVGESRKATVEAIRAADFEYPAPPSTSPAASPQKPGTAGSPPTAGVRGRNTAGDAGLMAHNCVIAVIQRMLVANPADRAPVHECRKAFRDADELLQEQDDTGDGVGPRVTQDGKPLEQQASEVITRLRA